MIALESSLHPCHWSVEKFSSTKLSLGTSGLKEVLKGECLHLAFQCSVMASTDSSLLLHMPAQEITQRSRTRLTASGRSASVLVVPSTWSTLFFLCVQVECHLLCAVCLDPSRGDQGLLRLALPCPHTHSHRCLYDFSTSYQGSRIRRPTVSHHPFLEHSPACEGLL